MKLVVALTVLATVARAFPGGGVILNTDLSSDVQGDNVQQGDNLQQQDNIQQADNLQQQDNIQQGINEDCDVDDFATQQPVDFFAQGQAIPPQGQQGQGLDSIVSAVGTYFPSFHVLFDRLDYEERCRWTNTAVLV